MFCLQLLTHAANEFWKTFAKLDIELKMKGKQIISVSVSNEQLVAENCQLQKKIIDFKLNVEGAEHSEKQLKENLNDSKKEFKKTQTSLKNLNGVNRTLKEKIVELENESSYLSDTFKIKHEIIDDLKSEDLKLTPPLNSTNSTNTPIVPLPTTRSEPARNIMDTDKQVATMCTHSGCFLRQPYFPQTPPPSKYLYPPSSIRLLTASVNNYKDFQTLHSKHHCEECSEGALFHNYHEIVHYPNPGPNGGTMGSQFRSCPNNQNARITIVNTSRNEKRRSPKINITCKQCANKFTSQENLAFHMKRSHGFK